MMSYDLPASPKAHGNYTPVKVHNGIAYVSGQVSRDGDEVIEGILNEGADLTEAKRAAEAAALRCLSALQAALGGLDRIECLLTVDGYIKSEPGFKHHAAVMNAASDVFKAVLGSQRGEHARVALGVSSIPSGGLVEIQMTAAVKG